MLTELYDKAADFFDRYNKIRISGKFDTPGVGITESEFDAWLNKVEGWLIGQKASIKQLDDWHRLSNISCYSDEYAKPNFHPIAPYERRLRVCVNFLRSFSQQMLLSAEITAADGNESVGEHQNIQVLVRRMELALESGDHASVLHSSASIFETMAKDVVNLPGVKKQSLGGFFDRYRKESSLPEEILDFIKDIYLRRNTTPLAGHGSTEEPQITKIQATILVEMTKAFYKIEYRLQYERNGTST